MTGSDLSTDPTAPALPTWALWLMIMALFCLVVALSASLVESLAGGTLPTVLRSGGTSFLAAATLCFGTLQAVRELRKRR